MAYLSYFAGKGLDAKDLEIMFQLDCNCRQSNAAIGKRVRLDKSVVAYRINRLQKKGFIKKFYTIVDNGKLGYRGYRIYLKWQFVNKKIEEEIIDYLKKKPFTWWIGEISGSWDLGFVTWVKDFEKFERFWFEFLEKYQKFIQKKTLAVYVKLYNCNHAFLSQKRVTEHKFQTVGEQGNKELTTAEAKVLEIVSENARMPTVEIAKKSRVSVSGVKKALKRLQQKGVIKGFRTQFDNKKLGFALYKVDFQLNSLKDYNKMVETSIADPRTIFVVQSIGFAEFEVEIMARNLAEVEEFTSKITDKYSNTIKEHNYFAFTKIHKIKYW